MSEENNSGQQPGAPEAPQPVPVPPPAETAPFSADQAVPVQPQQPYDATEPAAPVQPQQPVDATTPAASAQPQQPIDVPVQPQQPADATVPVASTQPQQPTGVAVPVPPPAETAAFNVDQATPAQPQQPQQPTDATAPVAPVQVQQPIDATAPVAPAQAPQQQPVDATAPVAPQGGYGQSTAEQAPYDPNQVQYGQPVQTPSAQDPYGQTYAQQPVQGQPYYGQPNTPVASASGSGSGKAMGALICGILAIFFSWLVLPGIILGIVAIVLASQYVKSFGKEGKATGAKVTGALGIIFSVISLVIYLILWAAVIAGINQFDTYNDSSDYTYEDILDNNSSNDSSSNDDSSSSSSSDASPDDVAAKEVTAAALKEAQNPNKEKFDELLVEYNSTFTDMLGISMADAGIDPAVVVQASLDSITFEVDSVYTYSDGTGSVFVEVESSGIWDYLSTFYDAFDKGSSLNKDSAEDRALVGQAFLEAVKQTKPSDYYAMFNLTKTGDTWSVTSDSLEKELEYIYGTY